MMSQKPKIQELLNKFKKKYKQVLFYYIGLLIIILLFESIAYLCYKIDFFIIFQNLLGSFDYSATIMPKWIFIVNTILGMINNALFLGIIVAVIMDYGDIQKSKT